MSYSLELVIGYLVCASGSWLRRVRDLLLFLVVTVSVSLSWILLYTFTPAADRPYVVTLPSVEERRTRSERFSRLLARRFFSFC